MTLNLITMTKTFYFNLSICLLSILSTLSINAQEETIYYNSNWQETVADSAAFYRPPIKKEGELFRIEDYFASGQLQMSGVSKVKDRASWDGVVTWYNADGSMLQQGTYKNNRLNGKFISFLDGQKLVATYDNGLFTEGSRNSKNTNSYFFTSIEKDTIKEIIYDENINGIRYENYSAVKGQRFLSKYYDSEGELIGERTNIENGYYDGLEVFYYYAPMRVRQVNYYRNGLNLASEFYYPNGNIRNKFQETPKFKKTFFAQNGEILGSAIYKLKRDYLKPESGTEYLFSYSYKEDNQGLIRAVRDYKAGQLLREELRYDNGTLKSITTYIDNSKDKQISYDENGKEFASMQYKGYYPLNGTEVIGDKQATYENGELINEITFYPKTKIVFSEKTTKQEVFYDKDGNVLGTLQLKYENKYAKPMNGKRFYAGYKNEISSMEIFEKGFIKERTTYRNKRISETVDKIFKRIEYYDDGSYNRIREVRFYSNGSIQSDITYKDYKKIEGKFYNSKEELIGAYNYVSKDGHLFDFFDDSDIVKLNQLDSKGELISLKRYNYGPNYRNGNIDAILEEEIDVTCCATSYTKEGDVFAKVVFKDEKPWKGELYDETSRVKYSIQEGLRSGLYQKFDYNKKTVVEEGQYLNDKKEGVFKYFSYSGVLERSDTFENDKLNGSTVFYGEKGVELATISYAKGLPVDGTKLIKNGYKKDPTEETYQNGLLVKRISFDDNGKRVTNFLEGKETQTIAYHKTTDKKRLSYNVENYYINGDVIRYDEQGKEQHRATFKNKKLESGTIYLTSKDTYDKRVSYVVLTMGKNKLTIIYKGKDDEVVFSAFEVIEPGYTNKYITKLNIYIDNIRPETLY